MLVKDVHKEFFENGDKIYEKALQKFIDTELFRCAGCHQLYTEAEDLNQRDECWDCHDDREFVVVKQMTA